MKKWSAILLLACAAQWTAARAEETNATAAMIGGPREPVLELHFKNAPLSQVFDYLSREEGFIIISADGILRQRVTLESQGALTRKQALDLLNAALASSGDAARLEGRQLTVGPAADVAGGPEVKEPRAWEDIPNDDKIVTQVIAVASLQPAALARELGPLAPPGATIAVSESGQALVMTARQADARRFAHIVQLLDHSADAAVAVIPLAHGDAKAIADELKEVFGSADSSVNTTAWTAAMAAGRGQRQGRSASGNGRTASGKNTSAAPVFTADETLNAVVAAAPPELMETIRNVITQLDTPSSELTIVRIFNLKHANPTEMADELTALFAPPSASDTAGSRDTGPTFFGPMGRQGIVGGAANDNSQTRRALKQAQVTAVADPRTSSVIVTASKTAMANIAGIIQELDASDAQAEEVTVVDLNQVDPAVVSDAMAALFASASGQTASALTVDSALEARAKTAASQQSPAAATSTSLNGSGSTSGSGR